MTSEHIVTAVVADANVLLSAAIGKAALRVWTDFHLTVHVTAFNIEEVMEYLPVLSEKYHIPLELMHVQWKLLALTRHPEAFYATHLTASRRDLQNSDPEDAHALALARKLSLPLWSNDRHLSHFEVPFYLTAKLLRQLEQQQSH